MNRQTFIWGRSKNQLHDQERWIEYFYISGLLLAALIIFTLNLGSLPLEDLPGEFVGEGVVAQVAKEIWHSSSEWQHWLFPTLWDRPYINHPPLIQDLIALFYAVGGVNEWTTRLPGSLMAVISVPLLYLIGREIFVIRTPALYAASIYLTSLPVIRYGRLAILDGPVLCFEMLTILSVLRSRRDLRWTLGVGLGFTLLGFTQGTIGLCLGAIALIFLAWDTPRLLSCFYLWLGIFLGCVPVIVWYIGQWIYYGGTADSIGLIDNIAQLFWQQFWFDEDRNWERQESWYYLQQILKYGWPWLLFAVYGLKLAVENKNWGWAKLVLVWSWGYLMMISLIVVKLPNYIVPIYPALALAGGAKLAQVFNLPSYISYPRLWRIILGSLAFIATIGCIYLSYSSLSEVTNRSASVILAFIALTLGLTAILIARQDRQFLILLFWGIYLSLVLLVCSPHWVSELKESYPIKDLAAAIKRQVPFDRAIYSSFDLNRHSLRFYSERQVIPAENAKLQQNWQQLAEPYFLLDRDLYEEFQKSKKSQIRVLENIYMYDRHWRLIAKKDR